MRVNVLVSKSARITKSLRGAKAMVAKTRVKVEDDEHESDIKKGEKFYLKKLGAKYYLIDMEGKDLYQFSIDAKKYQELEKKHLPAESEDKPKGRTGTKKTTVLVRTTNPAIQRKVEELVEFEKLEKKPNVKAYKKAQVEHKKAVSFNKTAKANKLEAEMKKLAKDKEVKAYTRLAAKGMTALDKMRETLTKHDPEFARIEKDLKAAEKRNNRQAAIIASGKLAKLVQDYKKSI
jgi:transposase